MASRLRAAALALLWVVKLRRRLRKRHMYEASHFGSSLSPILPANRCNSWAATMLSSSPAHPDGAADAPREPPWVRRTQVLCSECGERFLVRDAAWKPIGLQVDMYRHPEYSIFYRNVDYFWAARCLRCENARLRRDIEELQEDLGFALALLRQRGVANPLALRGV